MSDLSGAMDTLKRETENEKREIAALEKDAKEEENLEHKAEKEAQEHKAKAAKDKADALHKKNELQRHEQEMSKMGRGIK